MKIKDLLHGYGVGELQHVGIMKMLPITTENTWSNIGDFDKIKIDRDPSYDTLVMGTESEEITIIPHGIAFITEEYCQDRTIPKTYLMKKQCDCNANCIQSSQCGHFSSDKMRDARFIPRTLMLPAWEKSNTKNYSAIWNDIEKYNQLSFAGSRAYVTDFLKKYSQELEDFVAQFEVAKNQVGAFIFINDELVGIELVPNYNLWHQMWRPLIRDCYGSDCISLVKRSQNSEVPLLNIENINSISDLENETEKLLKQINDFTNQKVSNLIESEITDNHENHKLDDYSVWNIKSNKYIGDVVKHGSNHVIYMSLLRDESIKNRKRTTIAKARWEQTDQDPYRNATSFTLGG